MLPEKGLVIVYYCVYFISTFLLLFSDNYKLLSSLTKDIIQSEASHGEFTIKLHDFFFWLTRFLWREDRNSRQILPKGDA